METLRIFYTPSPDDTFEALRIEPFSSPPELPDVMKPQDSGGSANEQAVQ
jgi:transcription elongation factor B subunit 2